MEIPDVQIVHLIDDDDSLRVALTRLLNAAGFTVQAHASAVEFLLSRRDRFRGCLILDVRMPGGPSGLELQQALAHQGETLPIIFLTGHGDIAMGVKAIKDGAFDFLTKPIERDDLLNTVRAAFARENAVQGNALRQRDIAVRAAQLTRAETEIFRRVVAGQPNKQIAADLQCCERTVKSHRAQVMAKMGAGSLAELVQFAEQLNPARVRV
jgi:FixJ family two-component response regulator